MIDLKPRARVWPYNSGENTTEGLIELCREWIKPTFLMAEVGCFAGVSTEVFANFADTVFAVDPWTLATDYGEIPRKMVEEAEKAFQGVAADYPNIKRTRKFSVEAAAGFKRGGLDAVYIDAAHDAGNFAADLAAWQPKIRKGGLLMGHDYYTIKPFLPHKPDKVYSETSWVVQL